MIHSACNPADHFYLFSSSLLDSFLFFNFLFFSSLIFLLSFIHRRNIAEMKAAESGKPPAIVTKMVEGAIQKYLKEVSMMNQPFVKDATMTVEQYLKGASTEIKSYAFYVVGEGLEKKVDTFVAEIAAAQAKVAAAKAAGDNTIFVTTDKA
jgi:Elongation factor TS